MRAYYKFIILISLITTILVGCDPTKQNKNIFYETTDSIDLSKENIYSIGFDSSLTNVIEEFGEPTEIHEIKNPPYFYLVYKDKNDIERIHFRFVAGKVQRYIILTDTLKMEKGITVGDSKDMVIDIYGDSFYERKAEGVNILGYFDKENEINIEFALTDGNVSTILVSKARGEFSISHN